MCNIMVDRLFVGILFIYGQLLVYGKWARFIKVSSKKDPSHIHKLVPRGDSTLCKVLVQDAVGGVH